MLVHPAPSKWRPWGRMSSLAPPLRAPIVFYVPLHYISRTFLSVLLHVFGYVFALDNNIVLPYRTSKLLGHRTTDTQTLTVARRSHSVRLGLQTKFRLHFHKYMC